jgi:hypothetical protein
MRRKAQSFAEFCREGSLAFWAGMFASPLMVSVATWDAWREKAALAAEREGHPEAAANIRSAHNSEEVVRAAAVSPQ